MQISPRRFVRWAAVLAAMIFVVVACWHDPAYSHAGMALTLHSDGRGSVWADVAWADGHPVGEPVAAAVTGAAADGATIGPVAMAGTPGRATVRYEGTLPPGRWTVTVDAAAPAPGICTAEFEVGPGAAEAVNRCGPPPAPAPVAAPPAGDGGPPLPVVVVVAGVLLAGGAALTLTRRRLR
jgi:hypothetical protein